MCFFKPILMSFLPRKCPNVKIPTDWEGKSRLKVPCLRFKSQLKIGLQSIGVTN